MRAVRQNVLLTVALQLTQVLVAVSSFDISSAWWSHAYPTSDLQGYLAANKRGKLAVASLTHSLTHKRGETYARRFSQLLLLCMFYIERYIIFCILKYIQVNSLGKCPLTSIYMYLIRHDSTVMQTLIQL